MKNKTRTELQETIDLYRKGTKTIYHQDFNPFKEDIHAELLYLIDRQKGMQEGEIWQFFRPYPCKIKPKGDQISELDYQTNNHDKPDFQTYRTKRVAVQTATKYLKHLEEMGFIKKEPNFNDPITFNPNTNEILPYEVTPTGKNTSQSKVNRYYLTDKLFVLLARAFGIEDYFRGNVDYSKYREGFSKMNELVKKEYENNAIKSDVATTLGIQKEVVDKATTNPNIDAQIKKMNEIIGVCQKGTRKDFLERLTDDFENYYAELRTKKSILESIHAKKPFPIDYLSLFTSFLNDQFQSDWSKAISAKYLKQKRYNYPETQLLGCTNIMLTWKETGKMSSFKELQNLQNIWSTRDTSKASIDAKLSGLVGKKTEYKGNTKHAVPPLLR